MLLIGACENAPEMDKKEKEKEKGRKIERQREKVRDVTPWRAHHVL